MQDRAGRTARPAARRTRDQYRRHRHASSSSTVGERRDPGRAVGVGGVLGRGVRDAGRVADEQHRGRDPGRGQHARRRARPRSAAPAPPPSSRGQPVAQRRRRTSVDRRDRLGGHRRPSVPSRPARSVARLPDRPRPVSSSVDSSAARASSQAVTRAGDGVGGVGLDGDPADGGVRAGQPGLLVGRQHRVGVGQHRVVPVGHPGGAGVVGLAGEARAATGRAARSRWPRRPGVRRPAPGPARCAARRTRRCRASRSRIGPELAGVELGLGHGRRPGVTPSRSTRAGRGRRVERAGQQPRAQAGHAEPGALLLGERGDAERPGRGRAALAQQVDGEQRGDDRRADRRTPRRAAPSRGGCR